MEIKKNKSFIAEKAKIYNEEKKISSKAPVATVQISNISKNKENENKSKLVKKINDKVTHLIAGPYTSVNLLKNDYIKLKNFGFEELDIYINE